MARATGVEDPSTASPPDDGVAPPRSRGQRWALALALALVLAPIVVLLGRAILGSWTTTADYAALELRTRAVGGSHTPLIGPYSRYGWNHPGPLLFYTLALPYRALGSEGTGLLAGASLINASAIATCIWIGWRRAGLSGLVYVSFVIAIFVHALDAGFVDDPWNPYIVVLPVFAMMLLTWSVAVGDHWMLPFVVLLASFVSQSHVSMLLPSLACVGFATGFVIADARNAKVPRLRTIAIVTALVALVVWLPPVMEQFGTDGHNISALWDFWTSPTEAGPSAGRAARIVGTQLGVAPPWITGDERVDFAAGALAPGWTLPVALALLVGALSLAARRRNRELLSLCSLALVLLAVSWFSAARVVGEPLPYLLRWTWSVGALCWFAIGWTVMREIQARRWHVRALVAVGATAIGACFVIATTVAATGTDRPGAREAEVVEHLGPPVVAAMRDAPGPVLVRSPDTFGSAVLSSGVLAELVRAGISAGFDSDHEWVVGAPYALDDGDPRTVILVIGDEVDPAIYAADPHNREIARFDTLDANERATLISFEDEFQQVMASSDDVALDEWLHDHSAEIKRADTLKRRSARGAVYAVSSDA